MKNSYGCSIGDARWLCLFKAMMLCVGAVCSRLDVLNGTVHVP